MTSAMPTGSRLNERFQAAWQSLLPIGRDSGTGGYRRYAWTAADGASRHWFQEQAAERGLTVDGHASGNLLAWWDNAVSDRDGAVLTGSHLDSVPDGGAFDGPLGVVSALCAIDLLREKGVVPKRALGVAVFTDEEGARFGLSCVGSRLFSGLLSLQTARGLRDADGITVRDAMLAAGFDLDALDTRPTDLSRFSAFVELHIEQGRGLVDLGSPVGLATAIWPHGRWRCTFRGEANHAGTTRLVDRRDPMLPFATTVLAARRLATDAEAVATFGRVSVEPNATNGVPSAVHAWLDARAPSSAILDGLVEAISAAAGVAAEANVVALELVRESYTPEVQFDPGLLAQMLQSLRTGDLAPPTLSTGAGHDAGILSASMPAGMIFVRNPTGVSHSPTEHADIADCLDGVRALAAVLEDLVCR
jgi:N-carbamoyl-L-amino-acid hydrolase